jgi:hypothetical protein
MALDFPASPTNGQTFTSGGVTWQWDGAKWIVLPGSGGGAMLPITGGTLTGPLILAADPLPTAPLGAATRQYADAGVAAAEHNVGRSYIHNGLFNIAQRGAGGFTPVAGSGWLYTLDRWAILAGAAGDSATVQSLVMTDTNRTQVGDETATYSLANTFTGGAAAGCEIILEQPIERLRRLAGKTVTVSFWAAAGKAGTKLGVAFQQQFGNGGSPSAAVNVNGQAVTLTTAFGYHSVTFSIPSLAGKTLGTNGNDFTALYFFYSCGANDAVLSGNVGVQSDTVLLWGVQLELGPTATPLEKLDPRVDLANCQRFYQAASASVRSASTAASQQYSSTVNWPMMRAVPTATPYVTGASNNASGIVFSASSAVGGRFGCNSVAAGDTYALDYVYALSADL